MIRLDFELFLSKVLKHFERRFQISLRSAIWILSNNVGGFIQEVSRSEFQVRRGVGQCYKFYWWAYFGLKLWRSTQEVQQTKSIVCSLEEIRLMKRRKHKKFHINSVSNFLIKFSRNGESTYHNVMITFRLRTESNYNPLLTILEPHKTQLISSAYSFGRQFQLRESYNYNLQLHLVPLTRSRDHLKAISNHLNAIV